jgi:DNA-binding GntR family transcriptional regulator
MAAYSDEDQILQSRSVPELVREEIMRLITTGQLTAGDKLNEMDFARRFRISRAPIREAFRALEEAGLLKLERNRGVYVREIKETEAKELYELRASLDEMVGRKLAVRITGSELAELEGWLVRLSEAASLDDMSQYYSLNIEFHDRLVEMTGNATLLEFYRLVTGRMHLMRRYNFSVSVGSEKSQAEHRQMVAALKTRNPDVAGAALRDHVMEAYQRLTFLLHGQPKKRVASGKAGQSRPGARPSA